METAPTRTPERQAFYDRIAPANLSPLWEKLHALVTAEPSPACLPALWRYSEIRPYLMQAGALITAQEATRRVLILENPGLTGQATITGSLFAGLQLILPGETAPAHRHTQSALRFIIEGHGAYTAVDGERTAMQPGDFVITPSWTWHDHGNDTDEPMVWLDGLDIQIVRLLGASFAEGYPNDVQPVSRPEGDSLARFGHNLLPVDWKPEVKTSPVFNYPYARTREALAAVSRNSDPDPYHGYKLRYVNPASGGSAMPTIGTFIQLLPAGYETRPYRSTDGTVYVAIEGEGETRVGDTVLQWRPRDVFVVPSWMEHSHRAAGEAVLFSFSDRPVQEALGLWREARGNA
ncbi:MAG: gentisate 1,2-dioxygenase [Alphaproteobacteria bacterium]|nr:gentisate 1,2-dioxygenase [Alphaproteobacteria bacterium]MBV9861946.1 gentisate 1,2-dioxygenase [Alphaproteobacteria bacterium]